MSSERSEILEFVSKTRRTTSVRPCVAAEVPFENNIITLAMTGSEVAAAVQFSEEAQARHAREVGRRSFTPA